MVLLMTVSPALSLMWAADDDFELCSISTSNDTTFIVITVARRQATHASAEPAALQHAPGYSRRTPVTDEAATTSWIIVKRPTWSVCDGQACSCHALLSSVHTGEQADRPRYDHPPRPPTPSVRRSVPHDRTVPSSRKSSSFHNESVPVLEHL